MTERKAEPLFGQQLHVRAEKILAEALKAQGRKADSYSADEYLLALNQAQEDLDPTLSTKRLLAEFGLSGRQDDELATPVGNGLWRLRGKVLNDKELDAQLAVDAIDAERRARFERELGID